jgi:hypothetical protein
MKTVSIVVRAVEEGERLKPVPRTRQGRRRERKTLYLRWQEAGEEQRQSVGKDPSAVHARWTTPSAMRRDIACFQQIRCSRCAIQS